MTSGNGGRSASSEPAGVVFDLDGTLIDSIPDVVGALNRLLAEESRRALTLDEGRHMVGEGARPMVERAFAATGPSIPEEGLAALTERYLAIYRRYPVVETTIYPDVRDVLEAFRAAGIVMGVCTNKPHEMSVLVLDRLGLSGFFAAIIGGDVLAMKKPHAGHVVAVLDAMGISARDAVYVGDSQTDVDAARNVPMAVIAVGYGYSRIAPEALGADVLIADFGALPQAIANLAISAKIAGEG
ncbi:MAG TPA: HAD-IA family hydrolase [Rhodospirillales bacterium]|jgi:phosphoglycolate phosphatase|nr:HAD-IA family hydrolase [Rhodospirillales bacterium]